MEQNYLPKNIRQIGQVVKEPPVYIEDYVVTFARKLAERNKTSEGMAVLLGRGTDEKKQQPIFIKGAVEIGGWRENEGVIFRNEVWSSIYDGVKNYFPEWEIVGWLALRSGQEIGFDEKIKAIHENNFMECGNILFVYDKEEKEENVLRYEDLRFEKQSGYYIYYEKNEAMQNYMIETFGNKSEEITREEKVIEQVRELVANKESVGGKRTNNLLYAAGTALAAVILVIGATTLNNYDKVESMERTIKHISENIKEQQAGEEETGELVVETITGIVENTDVSAEKVQEKVQTENRYYIVQKGDTLGSISEKICGSIGYIEEIQKMNQIKNKDEIYEGQKLLVP